MIKHEADILLIRKYLNGELDARAMHQLEARAQDDPFLMDALEGYEQAAGDQKNNIADLSSRLQQRTEQKVRRIIPFRVLAIAASVLIVFTIGWLWLSNSTKPQVKQVAVLEKPPVKPLQAQPVAQDTTRAKQLAANIPASELPKRSTTIRPAGTGAPAIPDAAAAPLIASADKIAMKEVRVNKDAAIEKDTTPLNEMVVMDYSSKKKAALPDTASGQYQANYIYKNKPSATTDFVLQSKAAGVSNTPAISPFNSSRQQPVILQGKVFDNNDKSLQPTSSMWVDGKSYGALSNSKAKLLLKQDSIKAKSEFGLLGYNAAKVNTNKPDSAKTSALTQNNNSLSEVVVADGSPVTLNARPKDGWLSFNKYLKENAVSPDGAKGTVKLSFMVAADGTISNIKVTGSVSLVADKKAIDLLTNGPAWNGNSNGKPQFVKLNVRFDK